MMVELKATKSHLELAFAEVKEATQTKDHF